MILDPEEICNQIRSGTYENKKMVDTIDFFNNLGEGNYVPDPSTRIQVREEDRDVDFIERTVNKIKASKDHSKLEDLTLVYFPNEVIDANGKIFAEENSTKLLNGNHTAEIEIILEIFKANANIVNFATQLGSKISNVKRLGNLLNKQEVEKRGVSSDSVKEELYTIMDENEQEFGDPTPTDDQKQSLVNAYPHVSMQTIGQWISYHETVGSRSNPKKNWGKAELSHQRLLFVNQLDYLDFTVLEPRTLAQYWDTGVAAIFNDCMKENKRKALIIFYCSTIEQVRQIKETPIKKRIEEHYANLAKYYGLEIKTTFLRYE